jgi:hypothetical protein
MCSISRCAILWTPTWQDRYRGNGEEATLTLRQPSLKLSGRAKALYLSPTNLFTHVYVYLKLCVIWRFPQLNDTERHCGPHSSRNSGAWIGDLVLFERNWQAAVRTAYLMKRSTVMSPSNHQPLLFISQSFQTAQFLKPMCPKTPPRTPFPASHFFGPPR